jgi:hypothetical protein
MLSYEILDAIADAYNPALGVICFALIGRTLLARRWRLAGIQGLHVGVGLVFAYGLTFLDNALGVWPHFGLDYSTHTAVACVLVVFLAVHARRLIWLWIGSLIAYIVLMLYQGYHGSLDIVTTAMVVAPPLILTFQYLNSFPALAVSRPIATDVH